MANLYSKPYPLPKLSGPFSFKFHEDAFQELMAKSNALRLGQIKGFVACFDWWTEPKSKEYYLVTKVKPLTLQFIPYGLTKRRLKVSTVTRNRILGQQVRRLGFLTYYNMW